MMQNNKLNLERFSRRQNLNYLVAPTTNTLEILYELIGNGSASIETFGYMCGFRTRISELCQRYNLKLNKENKHNINKFGNKYTYVVHFLPTTELEKAIRVYKTLSAHGKILQNSDIK